MNPKELFKEGFNCAQSVFVPFAIENNLNKETALKIMGPYGGGLAKTDNLCGAVTGGITAIGLHFGHTKADDLETKQRCNAITQKFMKEFRNEFGSINCTGLIGHNLSLETEAQEANDSGVFDTKCPQYVETAGEIVKKLINEAT